MTRAQAGLTLIELMVGIAALAVLLVVAVPGFQALRQQYLVRSAGMAVYADLQLARSESIKRNDAVTVCFSGMGTTDWHYQLRSSVGCSGAVLESVSGRSFAAVRLTASYGAGALTFRPRRNTLASGNVTLSHGHYDIKVMTWNNGIIRTCSNHELMGVPSC
ncbi:GspH/FimT family pseudopilin [Zobellella sp. An-6]|uniref:GspH/FimT family pseudopilin n=1 Tax=Zobellella sp. An-6 TaxID=3400218 RepID=UPI004041263E